LRQQGDVDGAERAQAKVAGIQDAIDGINLTNEPSFGLSRFCTAPGTFSLPLEQPTATLSAITVRPLNPLSPPSSGARGLNTRYHWAGQFQPGNELWCATQGMDLACSSHRGARAGLR
jgi:hypothetical protein